MRDPSLSSGSPMHEVLSSLCCYYCMMYVSARNAVVQVALPPFIGTLMVSHLKTGTIRAPLAVDSRRGYCQPHKHDWQTHTFISSARSRLNLITFVLFSRCPMRLGADRNSSSLLFILHFVHVAHRTFHKHLSGTGNSNIISSSRPGQTSKPIRNVISA